MKERWPCTSWLGPVVVFDVCRLDHTRTAKFTSWSNRTTRSVSRGARRVCLSSKKSIEAAHDLGNAFVIGRNDLAPVLRVHARREGCRTD